MSLEVFRKHFLNIAVFIAVSVAVIISITAVNELRERSGIIFGNLPRTGIVAEPFTGDFKLSLEDPEMQNSARVSLIKVGDFDLSQVKAIADELGIKGKAKSLSNSSGKSLIKIEDKEGSLTYDKKDQSWRFSSLKKEGKRKPGFGVKEAKIVAESLVLDLNLETNLEIFRTNMLSGSSTHLSPTQDEKKAVQFEISFIQKVFDSIGVGLEYGGAFTVFFDRSASIVKVNYKPIQVDSENIGTYPLISLKEVEKRLEVGQGRIIYADSDELLANLSRNDKVAFTEIRLVYFSDEKNNIITPLWILEGLAYVNDKEIRLKVAVNAIVGRYLK